MSSHLLTLLPFAQSFDGLNLHFNILIIIRNINPLIPLVGGSPAFADADIRFTTRFLPGLNKFPAENNDSEEFPLPLIHGPVLNARVIYQTLGQQFNVINQPNIKLPAQKPKSHLIKKYLPISYRESFNFQRPATQEAVIDNSYRCTVRDAQKKKNPNFTISPDTVTWGEVLGFILRQPLLAQKAGLIRKASISLNADQAEKGGFLYVKLAEGSDYFDHPEITKSYAIRIPKLKIQTSRPVFSPVLFPLLPEGVNEPIGSFDSVFAEASKYDDGFAKIIHANQPLHADLLEEVNDNEPPIKDIGIRLGWDDEQVLIWLNRQMQENPDPKAKGTGLPLDSPLGIFGYRIDIRKTPNQAWSSLCKVRSKAPVILGGINLGMFENELWVETHPALLENDQEDNHYWLPQYLTTWNGKSMVLPNTEAASLYKTDHPAVNPKGIKAIYDPIGLEDLQLIYGQEYEFRVRLCDLTGGGPGDLNNPEYDSPMPVCKCHFKRFVAPLEPRIEKLPEKGELFSGNTLIVHRPRLEYPSVIYTGKYPDGIGLLRSRIQGFENQKRGIDLSLPDPDVTKIRIDVEVQSLLMDNQLSKSRKESYIPYYSTYRSFPKPFEASLNIPLIFKDTHILDFENPEDPSKDILGIPLAQINTISELWLPTSRNIRLIVRAECDSNLSYFGRSRSHIGKPIYIHTRKEASVEHSLFINSSEIDQIRGIFLRPNPSITTPGLTEEEIPPMIERLAGLLGLQNKGLTILAPKGRRLQLGCSSRIRHSLSPDHTSLTFANKEELSNHWIVAIILELNRDWTWDGFKPDSLAVQRRQKFSSQPNNSAITSWVGDIEVTRTASQNDLFESVRTGTTLLFLDAVEPKGMKNSFPDTIDLEYIISPNLKSESVGNEPQKILNIHLPITTPPFQSPKIKSAGIALSPYIRDEKYSSTAHRRKFLWIELDEPVQNPDDGLFCRVLSYSPDPILVSDTFYRELDHISIQEPSLNLNPEWTRLITPGQSEDFAGLDSMQQLKPAKGSARHFLFTLPSGIQEESSELFGFFKYEFRIGHLTKWSVAQARFGRPLVSTGVHHPPPPLFCNVTRSDSKLVVEAPFARAVWQGRNVTSTPPKTELWTLLYTQVKKADGSDFCNILLEDKKMDIKPIKDSRNPKLKQIIPKDRIYYGRCWWSQTKIIDLLQEKGLPINSPLSVICIEMYPAFEKLAFPLDPSPPARSLAFESEEELKSSSPFPLSNDLGKRRILRTSPLTKVGKLCDSKVNL